VNRAIDQSTGDYILLVNPDAIVFPESINLMLDFMNANKQCGVLGGELLDPAGYRQPCCRRFPNYLNVLFGRRSIARRLFPKNFLSRKYLYEDMDSSKPHKVDFVEGSLMLLRREALDEVGYFDEGFFLYVEDADLCYRMRQKGWETWWLPRTYTIHYRGETFRADNIHPALHHSRGLYRFFVKHYKPSVVTRLVLRFLLALRLVYVIATESLKKVFHDIHFSPPR
jgi:GT2 family glycosyltransferase